MRYLWLISLATGLLFAGGPKLDSKIFGKIKARSIGPATMSGRITDIDCPVSDPETVYVSTGGGGVWKSTDGGVSFRSIFDDYPQSIGCLTVDPGTPETVWVGTGEINTRNSVSYGHGLYKTTDGGKNWKLMGFADSERIAEIRVHPTDSKVVYVAVLGHLWDDHEERGLYKTTDGGEKWERILPGDETTGCIDVDLDPQEPDTLYAAMWQVRRQPYFFESGGPGSGLFKSVDGGKTFRKLTKDLPTGDLGRIDLDIAASRPNRLYAMVESENTGLYRSDDMGESWERISSAFGIKARPFYLSIIKIDPNDHNRVYNPSLFLAISSDGGRSWPSIFSGFGGNVHPDTQAIWINPNNSKHVIIGTDGGLYISRNGASSFAFTATLPVSQFYRVSVDDQVPYRVYGGLQDNGSWFAPSRTPAGIGNKHWVNVGGGDGFCVYSDAEDPKIIYWESQGGQLFRLELRTEENKSILPFPEEGMEKNRFNWNSPFAQSPTNPKTIYFGSQYLYRSGNRGDTWERISPDLTTDDPRKQRQEESGGLTPDATTAENHCTLFDIAESPLNENLVWAGTDDGNLQVTRDGGKNWENVVGNIPDLPKATWCSDVRPSSHREGEVYATFDGHRTGDKTPYVYKSEDFGKTWRSLATEDITGHCHVVLQDTANPKLLFLGTESGLFISFDGGGQWVHFRDTLPMVSIRDMVIQERERDLVLATHGRGIYVLDDITPLRHLTGEVLDAKVAILPSRAGRAISGRFVQDFQGVGYFSANNAPTGINITYYLKRRHMFGDLKLEVYNEDGELVKTLEGGKSKGFHRVYWNMRLKPPKAPMSSGLNFGSFQGPFVKTGKYKVKLVKGKDTYEIETELLPPYNNVHSDEDRVLQFQTTMKLYRMQEDVSFAAARIADLEEQCEKRAESLKKGALAKKLRQRAEELETLREILVAPNAGIFVTPERLRDEVVNLYAFVAAYSGRPSKNHLDRLEVVEMRLADYDKKAKPLLEVSALNKSLTAKGKPVLKLLDKQAWLEQEKTGGTSVSSGQYKNWARRFAPIQHLLTQMF